MAKKQYLKVMIVGLICLGAVATSIIAKAETTVSSESAIVLADTTQQKAASTSLSIAKTPTNGFRTEVTQPERIEEVSEGIIGDDNQYQIRDLTQTPYRQIVHLEMEYADGSNLAGSGAMIGADLILTAAHNIYNSETGEWAVDVLAFPSRNGIDQAPYGVYEAEKYAILSGFQTVGTSQYDIAVIKLRQPVDSRIGQLSISKEATVNQRIQVPGYPFSSFEKRYYMYTMFGDIESISGNIIRYQIDTEGGQSGSPVLNSQGQIIGVHITGYRNDSGYVVNGARVIDEEVEKLVEVMRTGIEVQGVVSHKVEMPTHIVPTTTSLTSTQVSTTKPTTRKTTQPTVTQTTPVYRLYHEEIKRHLYTKDLHEVKVLSNRGWTFEGEKFRAATKGTPVYRLYHEGTREHLYTTSTNERNTLQTRDWRYEGIAWYSTGQTPIYRLYHSGLMVHLYTADTNEKNVLSKRNWQYEGIGFFVQ